MATVTDPDLRGQASNGLVDPSPWSQQKCFESKKVLVSGGTTGIGRATACLLSSVGANVLVFGRHQKELDDALSDMKNVAKGEVHGLTADQAKIDDVKSVFAEVDEKLGGLDFLINNAGIEGESFKEGSYEDWAYTLSTNFLGYVACAKFAVERMKKGGKGHIVNIGSISAWDRDADDEVYSATKAAVQAFSEALRKSVAKDHIKVSLIEPGTVGTDMTAEDIPPDKQQIEEERGKMLKAEDVAECIRYLLSQQDRCLVEQVRITPLFQD